MKIRIIFMRITASNSGENRDLRSKIILFEIADDKAEMDVLRIDCKIDYFCIRGKQAPNIISNSICT